MSKRLKWEFVWNLPEFFHSVIRFLTGYILVAHYDDCTYEPRALYWMKYKAYVNRVLGEWRMS